MLVCWLDLVSNASLLRYHQSCTTCYHSLTSVQVQTNYFIPAIAGWVADRSTRRQPYLIGLIAMAISTLAFSLGRTTPVLLFGRITQGASSAVVHTVGMAILADTVGEEEIGTAMGFVTLNMAAGVLVGPMLGGILYDMRGFTAVFVSAYILIGIDFVVRLFVVERPKVPERGGSVKYYGTTNQNLPPSPSKDQPQISERETSGSSTPTDEDSRPLLPPLKDHQLPRRDVLKDLPQISEREVSGTSTPTDQQSISQNTNPLPLIRNHPVLILLSSPRMLAALLGALVQTSILIGLESTIPLRIKTLFYYTSTQVAFIFLFITLPALFAPLMGHLSSRYGTNTLVSAGFTTLTPCLILLRHINHHSIIQVALLCLLLLLTGISMHMIMTPLSAEVMHVVDEITARRPGVFGKGAYAQAFALMNVAYASGSLVGPLAGSFLLGVMGWNHLTLGAGFLSAVCVVPCFVALGRRKRVVLSEECGR